MLSLLKKKISYSSIEDDEYDQELKLGVTSQPRSSNITIKTGPFAIFVIAILFVSSIVSSWIVFFNAKGSVQQGIISPVPAASSLSCQRAPFRREWRTLTVAEQHDYVRAVRCLATKPSKLGQNGTLYDDFPWVHKHTSSNSTSQSSAMSATTLTRRHSLTDFPLLQLTKQLLSFLGIATTFICMRPL